MNEEIRHLVQQIADLEEQLRDKLHEQESRILFTLEGEKIRFESEIIAAHAKLRTNLLTWLSRSNRRNLLSAPVIYALIVPFALLDLSLFVYQTICFRLYRIEPVSRSRFIVIDRHKLNYLNSVQRMNCVYCAYANGLIAYAREIASRTEQYWCPIKHARRVTGSHSRYARFLDFGDAEDFDRKMEELRAELQMN
jgi:hypothetical protein